jgi:hypothetical protein
MPTNFTCSPLAFAFLDTKSWIQGKINASVSCRLNVSGWSNALQAIACGYTLP